MSEKIIEDRYIGDGVYASFDGWQVWLRTERDGQTHTIALEGPVFGALKQYFDEAQRRLTAALEARSREPK